jgi:hypothetical protein
MNWENKKNKITERKKLPIPEPEELFLSPIKFQSCVVVRIEDYDL